MACSLRGLAQIACVHAQSCFPPEIHTHTHSRFHRRLPRADSRFTVFGVAALLHDTAQRKHLALGSDHAALWRNVARWCEQCIDNAFRAVLIVISRDLNGNRLKLLLYDIETLRSRFERPNSRHDRDEHCSKNVISKHAALPDAALNRQRSRCECKIDAVVSFTGHRSFLVKIAKFCFCAQQVV